MSRYGGGCEETVLTVFRKTGEDENGCAQYTALRYPGIVEQHECADDSADLRGAARMMTGFLFPSEEAGGRPLPVSLVPGRDLLVLGAYAKTPEEARTAGAAVFTVLDTARPARFFGGRLVEWCHFRAVLLSGETV